MQHPCFLFHQEASRRFSPSFTPPHSFSPPFPAPLLSPFISYSSYSDSLSFHETRSGPSVCFVSRPVSDVTPCLFIRRTQQMLHGGRLLDIRTEQFSPFLKSGLGSRGGRNRISFRGTGILSRLECIIAPAYEI